MEYTINGVNYQVIETLERITSKDSFTDTENKLGRGNGAWEWHIGSKNDLNRYSFFEGAGFDVNCFLRKTDLIWLMTELQAEYTSPSQTYRESARFPQLYNDRLQEINALPNEAFFKFREHDGRNPADSRLYAKRPGSRPDGDNVYGLLRKLILPNITFVSILKLRADDGHLLFYFKIFPEFSTYDFDSLLAINEAASIESSPAISRTEKDQLIKARIGQGRFRNGIFTDCNLCPLTLIDDTRLLIASHIKPWSLSSNVERIDSKNGILLTPTIDKLFDSGLISFGDDQTLIVSPWLSQDTITKLNLNPGGNYQALPVAGREPYLAYHRQNILKL